MVLKMPGSGEPRVCLQDFEDYAHENLPLPVSLYFSLYAGDGQTDRDCKKAFKRYRILPRLLRDVSNRQMATTVLGQPISFPIGVSPTAAHKLGHVNGEIATAKATANHDTVMIVSNAAMYSISDISSAVPKGLHWAQLYLFKKREYTAWYVRQAERAGFKALVLTCDAPVLAPRPYRGLIPTPELRAANMDMDDPEVQHALASGDVGLWSYITNQHNDKATWKDVKWLKSITNLPIVAKGILTGESAIEAVEAGADAILVSAHGGRQLDGVPATIDALSYVVKAVQGTGVEVFMDGGVRTGTDVFKALALGARAVFLGRPILWGLAYDGETGVNKVLDIIKSEFSTTMALAGCATLDDIVPSMVVHQSKYLSKL